MSRRELHRSVDPWRINKIYANYTHAEVENKNLIRTVRAIFNKVTPTTKEVMTQRLHALNIYESPVLDEILSLIFEKAVLEPIFCPLYVEMCGKMVFPIVAHNEATITGSSKIQNALLVRAQEMFSRNNSGEFERKKRAEIDAENDLTRKRVLELKLLEAQSMLRRRRLGHIRREVKLISILHNFIIRWLGSLYLHNLISIRIITFCVVDLLKTVTTRSLLDGFHPDQEAVECAVRLLEVIGKRLDEEAAAAVQNPSQQQQPPFPLELTFQTLNGAMPLVTSRIRFLIMDLLELRAREWVPRRTEELPRTLDEIKEEIKKEKRASLLSCFVAPTKKVTISSHTGTVESRKSSAETARENSEKEARSVMQMNSLFMADKQSTTVLKEEKGGKRGTESPASSSTRNESQKGKPIAAADANKAAPKIKPIDTSIATDSFDELTDECCCTICHEFFDSDKFIPRSFDCGHEFCELCINNANMRINDVVKCPICEKTTNVSGGRELPIVYKLISISEKLIRTRADPKISCNACKLNFSPGSLCMCNKQDCKMFSQLLCLNCALDGNHIAHVVKYDVRIEKIRKELKVEVGNLCSQVEVKNKSVLDKAKELGRITAAVETSLKDAKIPEEIIGQLDSLASEQDVNDYREIVRDLANTLINGCRKHSVELLRHDK